MRPIPASLAALSIAALVSAASPAAAQVCDCGFGAPPGVYVENGPATLLVPRTTYVPHTRTVRETVLVPRTRLVRRTVTVPRTVYTARTSYTAYPAYGYPTGYHYGATYVPPGTTYGCTLGVIGCDSSAVGPIGY